MTSLPDAIAAFVWGMVLLVGAGGLVVLFACTLIDLRRAVMDWLSYRRRLRSFAEAKVISGPWRKRGRRAN